MNFANIINKNNRMSFRDELNKKVIETRERIKSKAINSFVEWLKSVMNTVAKEGKTAGYINLEDDDEEDCEDEDEYEYKHINNIYNELQKILIIEEIIYDEKVNIYNWLLKEIQKTDVFKDININIDLEKQSLHFYWCL